MKYLIFTFLIVVLAFGQTQAQKTTDDINNITNSDKRYDAAKELLEYYRLNSIDSLKLFVENLEIEKSEDRFDALKVYAFAEYYYELYDLGNALNYSLDAIYIYKKQNLSDKLILAKLYNLAGLSSEQLFRYEQSLEYYEKGLELANQINNQTMLAELYSNRSFVYYGMGDFSTAIANLEKASDINKAIKDTVNIAKDLNNLGYIYTSWGKYEMGIEYYQKALDYSMQKGIAERSAICNNNIGMSYFQQGEFELAEDYILRALQIDKANGFDLSIAKRYNNLGLVYYQQGRVEESVEHFEMAGDVFLEKGDSTNYAKSIINIADIYFQLERNAEAYQYLEKGYNISLGTNNLPLIEHNTGKMYRYYKSIGGFEKALEYKELFDVLSDSIYSLESAKVVEELETMYETEKKEEEIKELSSESALKETIIKRKNQQRNLLAGFAVILLVGLIVIVLISIKIRKQSRELESLNNVKNRLFAIISHDLRGYSGVFQDAGMVIRHHVKKENYDKVNSISENLEISAISYSSQLDNILSWSTLQLNGYKLKPEEFKPYVECNTLIESLSKSQKLKGNRFANNINPDSEILMDKGAFSIMLRNLLANANKFTEQGVISINLKGEGNVFKLSVSDTGIGLTDEMKESIIESETVKSHRGTRGEKGSGVGLGLVKNFVKLSGGKFSVESELGKGTTFILDFS